MTPLLMLTLVLAQPEEDYRPISPARSRARVALLPGLADQVPGEVLSLVLQAEAELNKAVPDRFNTGLAWKREADALLVDELGEIEGKRFEAVLKPAGKALALWEQAARAGRCDWTRFTNHLRQHGLHVGFGPVPDFLLGAQLCAVQARWHLKQDRPAEAVRRLALALSLVRHAATCPRANEATTAAAFVDPVLDVLTEVQSHPRCPSLYNALAALPRPFLSPRPVVAGLRLALHGVLPAAERLRADPVGAALTDEDKARLERTFRLFTTYAGQRVEPLTARVQMGLAIQRSDAAARAALREAGYTAEVVAATPSLNAAILHALLVGEETLARQGEALALPIEAASARIEARPRGPVEAGQLALPAARYVLALTEGLVAPFAPAQRRLDLLRAVEALRLHAHATGKLPAKLDEVTVVAVPVDPLLGEPLLYQREGAGILLETPEPARPIPTLFRVTLRLRLRTP